MFPEENFFLQALKVKIFFVATNSRQKVPFTYYLLLFRIWSHTLNSLKMVFQKGMIYPKLVNNFEFYDNMGLKYVKSWDFYIKVQKNLLKTAYKRNKFLNMLYEPSFFTLNCTETVWLNLKMTNNIQRRMQPENI